MYSPDPGVEVELAGLAVCLRRAASGTFPSATHVTNTLTEAVMLWAHEQGWTVHLEVPLACVRGLYPGKPERQGYVDAVVTGRAGRPPLVIEIDRANKLWSALKLGAAADQGMTAVWVRWMRRPVPLAPVPAGVTLITVTVQVAARRSRSSQLAAFD